MSTEALLTVASLMAAAYQLLPDERRKDLRLRLGAFDLALCAVALVVIHWIKYADALHSLGVPMVGKWRPGFTPENASYLIVVAVALVVSVRVSRAGLPPRKVRLFQELAETLLFSKQYPQLLFLLDRSLNDLARQLRRRDLASRLHDLVVERQYILLGSEEISLDGLPKAAAAVDAIPVRLRRAISRFLDRTSERDAVRRFLARALLAAPFVSFIAHARPYFALRVLQIEAGFDRAAFQRLWLGALLDDPHSALYEEIRDNQISAGPGRYRIDPLNPLIFFYFGDDFRAEPLALYKPVADLVLDRLRDLRSTPEADPYRKPIGSYVEEGKATCPLFAGFQLFDYMISEALARGVNHHLWLSYVEYFAAAVLRNLGLPPHLDANLEREWPTPYHYLLYCFVQGLRDWVVTAAALDRSLPHVSLDDVTIPSEAIDAIGVVMGGAFSSSNLHPGFKVYLLSVVLHGYEQLVELGRMDMARRYQDSVVRGAHDRTSDREFREGLIVAIQGLSLGDRFMPPSAELVSALEARAYAT